MPNNTRNIKRKTMQNKSTETVAELLHKSLQILNKYAPKPKQKNKKPKKPEAVKHIRKISDECCICYDIAENINKKIICHRCLQVVCKTCLEKMIIDMGQCYIDMVNYIYPKLCFADTDFLKCPVCRHLFNHKNNLLINVSGYLENKAINYIRNGIRRNMLYELPFYLLKPILNAWQLSLDAHITEILAHRFF